MITRDRMSLSEAADALGLERSRVLRLGRYLHLAPGDRCIPSGIIWEANTHLDSDERYHILLNWLLECVRSRNGSEGAFFAPI